MRFFAFLLGIAEANAFSCYKIWGRDGHRMAHGSFKDNLAFTLLEYCKSQVEANMAVQPTAPMQLRSQVSHEFVKLIGSDMKRVRKVCKTCYASGRSGHRVQTRCSCNSDPMCKNCHIIHLEHVWITKRVLN